MVGWQLPDHFDMEQPESEINALIEDLRCIVSGWHIRSLEEIGGPWKHQFDESAVQAYANIQSNLEVPF